MPSFHWWRTVLWLIPTIGVYTSVLGTISVIAGTLGAPRLAHGCARLWSWLILATTGVNVTVRGMEKVPRGRPFLFLANHQSYYDIPVVFWYVPFDLRIIAKESAEEKAARMAWFGSCVVNSTPSPASASARISRITLP